MFSGHRVIYAPDPALNQRPEALNRVRVDVHAHVNLLGMVNPGMFHSSASRIGQVVVARVFVRVNSGCGQDALSDESSQRLGLYAFNFARKDTSAALDSAHDRSFLARNLSSCSTDSAGHVARPSAVIHLIDFYRSIVTKLRFVVLRHQFRADQVEHAPRGFVGHTKFALQLLRGDPATHQSKNSDG